MLEVSLRHDWSLAEILNLFEAPLEEVTQKASEIHWSVGKTDVQQCELLSIKTGGCPENCGYCSQSAHYDTPVKATPLMDVDAVITSAKAARERGATRFCLGAAWRDIPAGPRFEKILEMVKGVAKENMEVCCTLGMATEEQLHALKDAGLTAYNHNLDTGKDHYSNITTTRTYEDRIRTLQAARRAGVQVCCGGILGMGESVRDRAMLLQELSNMNPHPESVPVNLLVPVEGTPLEALKSIPFDDFLRMVAIARILMPHSRVRLSAGRNSLSETQQRRCFEVGANSIFVGEKLLTAANVGFDDDARLLANL